MIDEDATKEAFNYYSYTLPPQSHKPILAACDGCDKVRETSKHSYRLLCLSCAMKRRELTEEWKTKIGAANKGKKRTEEEKAKMCTAHKGIPLSEEHRASLSGEKNHNYKGGKKLSIARRNAKRKRQLGYKLLLPLEPGEVGHHFDNEHVIGVPEDIHSKIPGNPRERHRALVLEWLKNNDIKKYKLVLCVLAKEPLCFRYRTLSPHQHRGLK